MAPLYGPDLTFNYSWNTVVMRSNPNYIHGQYLTNCMATWWKWVKGDGSTRCSPVQLFIKVWMIQVALYVTNVSDFALCDKMAVWVMWRVQVLHALISISLMPVAGDYLFHSSLTPRLLFCPSLYLYVVLSAITSLGKCIALGGTSDYVLYSFSCSVTVIFSLMAVMDTRQTDRTL